MSLISEKGDVQDQLINYLIGIGWEYLPPATVASLRGSEMAYLDGLAELSAY